MRGEKRKEKKKRNEPSPFPREAESCSILPPIVPIGIQRERRARARRGQRTKGGQGDTVTRRLSRAR
jgi:hypothetical protein